MIPFLIKNLLIISSLFFITVLGPAHAQAAKFSYQLEFDARYGVHLLGPADVATNRHTFEYQQKMEFNKEWSAVLGLRAEVEAAYASNTDRYSAGDVAKKDSQSFFPRDNYLQYKGNVLRARLGYQQVVWGETFGSYYADIVNPKDFREAGLGDLSRNRLSTAMVNLQWIFASISFQTLFIPKASFNLLPSAGSDFNPFKAAGMVPSSLVIQRDPASAPTRSEYGARVTQQFSGGLDLSLFYLNYNDRMPVYRIVFGSSPTDITASPDYKPLQTFGTTATYDLMGYLLRAEVLEHLNREMNTQTPLGISSDTSNELIAVVGIDFPGIDKWQLGLQYSESHLQPAAWLGRDATQAAANIRVAKSFASNLSVEALLTAFTSDASTLAQLNLSFPVSSRSEFLLGVDKFDGAQGTALGRFRDASRAWAMFKLTLQE